MIVVAATRGFGEPTTYALQAALLTLALAVTAGIASQLRGLGLLFKGQILDIFGRPAVTLLLTLGVVLAGWRLTVAEALWIQVGVAIAAAWISFAWIRAAIPKTERAVPRAKDIRWLGAAVPLAIVDTVRQMDGAYGVILMGWLSSAPELGLFRVAVACGVIINMPITIAHVLFGPTAARLNGTREHAQLQRLLTQISAALVAIILPMTAAVWFFGREAMTLVFGPPYAEAWLPLFFVSCAQLVSACFGLGPTLLAMCDSEKHLMKICALSVAAGVVAAVPLIQLYGAAGAGIATIVSGGLIALFSQRFARRSLNLDPSLLSFRRR
jgi:O-antigen/teichoic acid export membrane protein